MKTVSVRVPVRADLAGGTLDLWPLYLFHPGSRTINVAISHHAECRVDEIGGTGIELVLTDHQYRASYSSIQELSADRHAALIAKAVEHFHLHGIRITTRTDVPRGSGLGGSSALAVALVRALSELAGTAVEGDDLIALVRDLETRLLNVPAGVQDYYPPVYGGLAALHLEPGGIVRHPISLPLGDLAQHFILHYSEIAHFSGTNNWEIYKRHIDGDESVRTALGAIARTAQSMEHALETHDLPAAGAALAEEWSIRKSIIRGISTPEIDAAVDAAVRAGAWGAKVCGAGGGGCIVFLTPAEHRARVLRALRKVPGRTLDASPVPYGLVVETATDSQVILPFSERLSRPVQEPIEQLYLTSGGTSPYQPHVLIEGAITFDDARRETHVTVSRTILAPVDVREERIQWEKGLAVDAGKLHLRAVPDPKHEFSILPTDGTLLAVTSEGEESFRAYLEDTERLTVFHNASLGLYSEPGESRGDFEQRCREEGTRGIEDDLEHLERTFRRRIDQMRERVEREDREMQEGEPEMEAGTEVNISWDQALYNITTGKPLDDNASSPREEEYMQRIAALQKSWERETEAINEQVSERASQIEEVALIPSRRNIDIRRYVVVWASGPPDRKSRAGTTARRRRAVRSGS
jgi:D-glycero-alpha-D-manno-heptose-7-phosphate kinase